ncbi:MAG: maleylacetoacetate isomerase [Polyangiaceae bacterium]
MVLRLYDYWRSSSAWRVRIALHLKGLPFESTPVDLFAAEQMRQGYREKNRLSQVPVLSWTDDDGEHHLSQSLAIIDYLDTLAEPRLVPEASMARARALQLTEIVNAGIQPLQNRYVLAHVDELGGDGATFAAHFIARGLSALEEVAAATAGDYLVGDTLSVADVFLVPQLDVGRRMGVDLDPMPTLRRVEARCIALPAFDAAHPTHQPGAPAR